MDPLSIIVVAMGVVVTVMLLAGFLREMVRDRRDRGPRR